jgi:hypothetical protein
MKSELIFALVGLAVVLTLVFRGLWRSDDIPPRDGAGPERDLGGGVGGVD